MGVVDPLHGVHDAGTEIEAGAEQSQEIVDAVAAWMESEHAEALIRDAQADWMLLRELDLLLPDTIAASPAFVGPGSFPNWNCCG